MPGVSITTYLPSRVKSVSMASLVVPERRSHGLRSMIVFAKVDFPTFCCPIRQKRILASDLSIFFFREERHHHIQ